MCSKLSNTQEVTCSFGTTSGVISLRRIWVGHTWKEDFTVRASSHEDTAEHPALSMPWVDPQANAKVQQLAIYRQDLTVTCE